MKNEEQTPKEPQTEALHIADVSCRKEPIAWACRTCNKIDWADAKEQLAKPEHISHRGVDIGSCKGKMIPLYGS